MISQVPYHVTCYVAHHYYIILHFKNRKTNFLRKRPAVETISGNVSDDSNDSVRRTFCKAVTITI